MRVNCAVIALTLGLAGCATAPAPSESTWDDDDFGLAVRKVEIASDIAVIRPDFQIVVGSTGRVMPAERALSWETAPARAVRAPQRVQNHEPAKAMAAPAQAAPVKRADHSVRLTDTHFEFGSAKLTKDATAILDRAVEEIQKIAPKKLSILGHTDSVGGDEVNLKLSEQRAAAVFDYLRAKGVKVKDVEYVGFGKKAPIADNKSDAGRAKNRRAEIIATIEK